MKSQMKLKQFAFDERSESMKAPVGLLSDRTVLRSKMKRLRLFKFFKQETVLSVAAVLAVLSMFFVPPDADYLGYIDLRTLAILFSLMTIMAGLRRQGVFDRMGRALTIPVVCMQTIAANLGSMLTPIGNPQNLYLYGKSGMSMAEFLLLMFPYTVVSLLLLVGWAVAVCRKQASSCIGALPEQPNTTADRKIILLDAVLFAVCLLAVVRVLPYGVVFAAVLVCTLCADRSTLRNVDYSLLLTFVAFFVFIGNLGRIPAFSGWLQAILAGREVLVAVLASQVTSNVPAALLLSGFTDETAALIIGTNLGGLGTLIASMASLISYRQIARELPEEKGRYFKLFTLSNLIFLVILLAEWRIIGR